MTHIGQGGMVDDWWQSAPGKIEAPLILSWESGAKNAWYITNEAEASQETTETGVSGVGVGWVVLMGSDCNDSCHTR